MQHQQIIELMPLYLNDQLDVVDSQEVKTAIENDEQLQQELTLLQMIKYQVQGEQMSSPGNMGWSRLKRDIEAAESRSRQQSSSRTSSANRWWKTATIAASLALVVQTGVLIQHQSAPPDNYRPLSTSQLETTVSVKFDSGVSESQLRQLLVELQGNIVEGPSAQGIYQIRFENQHAAIQQLNANGLVDYAQATAQSGNIVQVKFNQGVSEVQLRQLLTELGGSIVQGPSAIGIYHVRFNQRQSAIQWLNASGLVDYAEWANE